MLQTKIFKAFFVLLLLACGLSYYVLLKIDPATTTVPPRIVPEVTNHEYSNRPFTALLSYADGPEVFFRNQFSLSASAADKGFDIIYNFRKGHIDEEFYTNNRKILEASRGAGYWLWKPYFILKTMQSLPEDSIIFYADSGVVFNKPIEPIVKMLDQHDIVLVGHGNPITLTRHAKAETFILAPELAKTKDDGENIWAFFLALRNNQKNRDFIKRWLDLCMIPEAIMDLPLDPAIQLPNFTLHQHDQSLLSLLVASEPKGKAIIKRNILRKEYGVRNFHRHDEEKLTSPLYLQSGLSRLISNIFWNNYLLQYLRKE